MFWICLRCIRRFLKAWWFYSFPGWRWVFWDFAGLMFWFGLSGYCLHLSIFGFGILCLLLGFGFVV